MKKKGFEIQELAIVKALGIEKFRLLLSILILFILYLFYLSQNLFFVNSLNDFDEYFIRAEMWANGDWNWGGGPDKLLSLIEFFSLKWFSTDFLKFYHFTNIILITLMFIALGLFINRKNDALPEFNWKFLIAAFTVLMPFYAVENLTLDESAFLSTMLLFFLCSYNNRYLGFVGLLVYLSRPEGILIVGLYIILLIADKLKRKEILINFISFVVLLTVYKFVESKFLAPGISITGDSAIDNYAITNFQQNTSSIFFSAIVSLLYLPVYTLLYAIEVFQNIPLLLLFCIGFLFSLSNKKMWVFYGIVFGYAFLYLALNGFRNPFDIGIAFKIFDSKLSWITKDIEIANGYNMSFNVFGHSRYRVFLYPSLVAFVIAGISVIINFIRKFSTKQEIAIKSIKKGKLVSKSPVNKIQPTKLEIPITLKEKIIFYTEKLVNPFKLPEKNAQSNAVLGVVVVFFILMNFVSYKNFSKPYQSKKQLAEMNDYYKIALEIRKTKKINDLVLIPNICNCNLNFFGEFEVLSGTRYMLMPVCENCNTMLVGGHPEKKSAITAKEIEEKIPSRAVIFDRYTIDYPKVFNPQTISQINLLFQKFDLIMLDSLNVNYIISQQALNRDGLLLKKQIGQLMLYENLKAR